MITAARSAKVFLLPIMLPTKAEHGYIAITSAMVISLLLITMAVSLGFVGIFSRFDMADSQAKRQSVMGAHACISRAQVVLARGINNSVSTQGSGCGIINLAPNPPRTF